MLNIIIITKENQGQRLDKFLNEKLAELSRSQIQKMIKNGEILVNGQENSVHKFLKEGDKIEIGNKKSEIKTKEKSTEKYPSSQFTVANNLFKDIKIVATTADFLIIEKPAGLLVHPTDKLENNTLVDWLIKKYPSLKGIGEDPLRPGIVHRLDKDVSGLMIIPLNQKSFDFFKQQFKLRLIDKRYTALVYGETAKETDEINFAIGRSRAKEGLFAARPSKAEDMGGQDKQALTEFDVIRRFKNYTLLEIKILTGRTHQIRVHLKAYGHPIVGDQLYFNKKIKTKKSLNRIFLHAHFLSFISLDGQVYEFSSPLPEKLASFLKSLPQLASNR